MENNVLEKINKSTQSILASQSVQEVCEIIVEEGKNLTAAEHGIIYLAKQGSLEIVYATFPPMAKLKPKRRGLVQKAYLKGEIVIVHVQELAKIEPKLEKNGIRSLILLPLLYHNKPIGALVLHSSKEEFFTEKELDLMRLFRTVASIALEKTQLHVETQNALETRDRFIALASHELRTPLTSINGYIQLLYSKLTKTDTPEARWIKELYSESIRLTHLVKELLDINRIKQGQLQFLLSEVSVEEILKRSIERLEFTNPEVKVLLRKSKTANNYNVIGDSEKLFQMTNALLNNAMKFSKPQTIIDVSLQTKTSFVVLKIQDKGKGIPPQDLERIFEGFYKSNNAENEQGMGVGLLLAKHVVEMHKGKLKLSSEENKGTTIEVKLPRAKI